MEYLLVNFLEDRDVLVNTTMQGRTGQIIELEKGTHIVSLRTPPRNFRPRKKKIVLADTSVLTPKEVIFEKI